MASNSVPPNSAPKSPAPANDDANALWRIPEWFPKLPPQMLGALKSYHAELLRFNSKVNLISRNTERDADETHFADCILAFDVLQKAGFGKRVHDIGSGNGLPGLIMAILDPTSEFILVESDARKSEFLKHVTHLLGLKNVQVMSVRFETLQSADVQTAVSRGFASVSKTCLMANKIFPKGSRFFHLKGNSWSSEIAEIPSQLISVWSPELVGEYSLPVSQARRAIVSTTKKM